MPGVVPVVRLKSTCGAESEAIVPRLQVTVFEAKLQEPWSGVALLYVICGGIGAVKTTPVAVAGPLFLMMKSNVNAVLCATGEAGLSELTSRSTVGEPTVIVQFPLLFVPFGSFDDDTVAVLMNVCGVAGVVALTKMSGAMPPGSAALALQVTVAPTTLHVQPLPLALMAVCPVGSVSVTETLFAKSGLVLLTSSV